MPSVHQTDVGVTQSRVNPDHGLIRYKDTGYSVRALVEKYFLTPPQWMLVQAVDEARR